MYGRFDNKTAFITGVAKPNGIAWAVARALAEEGVKIGITDISPMVHQRAEELRSRGTEVHSWVTDLRSLGAVKTMAAEFVEKFGKADILCNVAGMAITGGQEEKLETVLEMDEKDWDFSIELNLKTTFNAIKAFLPYMVKNGYGRIVNCSSVTGPLVSNPGRERLQRRQGGHRRADPRPGHRGGPPRDYRQRRGAWVDHHRFQPGGELAAAKTLRWDGEGPPKRWPTSSGFSHPRTPLT
jgi:NAD(P)-dependent dehydrogenase (short-subunit alcohol dehydrogenase family)